LRNNEFLSEEQRIKLSLRDREQRSAGLELAHGCRDHACMADIFSGYTKSDRDWAFWIWPERRAL
jgi:hypothetical protein